MLFRLTQGSITTKSGKGQLEEAKIILEILAASLNSSPHTQIPSSKYPLFLLRNWS